MPSNWNPTESVTLAQTQLRGIARVLTFEHPELRTTMVDLDPDGTEPLPGLVAELLRRTARTRWRCVPGSGM